MNQRHEVVAMAVLEEVSNQQPEASRANLNQEIIDLTGDDEDADDDAAGGSDEDSESDADSEGRDSILKVLDELSHLQVKYDKQTTLHISQKDIPKE